jgi:hypothetical protein
MDEPPPSQKQVDAIAFFIEAVRELKRSPFFVEEFATLTLSMKEGDSRDQVVAQLPDPNVVRGVLVSFRRVWQQNEPCHFGRISNILKKHLPFFRVFIDPLAVDKTADAVNMFPQWKNGNLSFEDLINVWLNTRYHHVGSSKECGKFDRADFERLEKEIGEVLFEYYFLWSIWIFGIYFFNILPFAENFLADLALQGVRPSFSMADGNADGRIQRVTPGYTPATETPAHRVWCLRRRRSYEAFNNFLKVADFEDGAVARLVSACDSFDEFSAQSGKVLSHQTAFEIDTQKCSALSGVIDTHMTAVRNRRSRRGLVGKTGKNTILLSGEASAIISEQYLAFRNAFQREPFE